jgi:hypothetical protein
MDKRHSQSGRMTVPGGSSKMVWLFGFLFLGLAGFSMVRHIYDPMTYTFLLLGLLALVVARCLQSIEIRIEALELSLLAGKKLLE